MKTKLKQFRVAAGMTQAKVAAAVGVTQPNYHRWEVGAAPVPEAKLKKLARVLKTNPDALLGRHPPVEVSLYDSSASDDLSYYGEVAIHFCGGGEPLLLSISEGAFARLHRDLQGDAAFVVVQSLANQTVIIRTKAVSDLYFSSEAYDDYGPEHDMYTNHLDVQIPDARDWEIIEGLADDDIGEDFDPADVERVSKMIMITDKQYEKLVSDGLIKAEDLESEREKNRAQTDRIMNVATKVTYQFSTGGKQRSVDVLNPEYLFDAFYEFVDFDGGGSADGMIRWEAEGRHRIIFISKEAVDYVAIPTHKFEEGRIERTAEALEDG
ncbi:helix-turn-helix transcriptional regulator [Bradyrhizobium sediminis]|uniref:Helix-turn-helix transcriptional regulator n=1 Tax=Bradyrhizobium sediminis TaxID=2840469 RepID=A0A975NCK2_9BRAD|nr:helix-turn-helix transcriptional regulator [Bradyrhizobium sediminis]QWG12632.1 helix-turn-helix transcriptional regulator [Bradyrhizobium sediminis]